MNFLKKLVSKVSPASLCISLWYIWIKCWIRPWSLYSYLVKLSVRSKTASPSSKITVFSSPPTLLNEAIYDWPSGVYLCLFTRAYFWKIECPGIGRLIKKAQKKKKKPIWIKRVKSIFRLGCSSSTSPSGLSKCPFLKQRCPFIAAKSPFPKIFWFNSFILEKPGSLDQKEIQINLFNIYSILIFNGFNLFAYWFLIMEN